MALARLVLKNFKQRGISSSSAAAAAAALLSSSRASNRTTSVEPKLLLRSFSAIPSDHENQSKSEGQEIAVTEGDEKKSKLVPKSLRRWRNNRRDIAPFDLFPSGLGDALLRASENLNSLFHNLTPSRLIGRMKEKDDYYKLKYEVPGLGKEDIKITVEDGFLVIKGEHKEEEGSDADDEHWSSYGYYNTSVMLPDDAKVDEIKAEMKDGVLCITIPRTERREKDVKEVTID